MIKTKGTKKIIKETKVGNSLIYRFHFPIELMKAIGWTGDTEVELEVRNSKEILIKKV